MYIGLYLKYPLLWLLFSDFNEYLIFSTDFSRNIQISNFIEIRPVEVEFLHEDEWTDITKQISLFVILRTRLIKRVEKKDMNWNALFPRGCFLCITVNRVKAVRRSCFKFPENSERIFCFKLGYSNALWFFCTLFIYLFIYITNFTWAKMYTHQTLANLLRVSTRDSCRLQLVLSVANVARSNWSVAYETGKTTNIPLHMH